MIATNATPDTRRPLPLSLRFPTTRAANDNSRSPASYALDCVARWDAAVDAIGPAQRPARTDARAAYNHALLKVTDYQRGGIGARRSYARDVLYDLGAVLLAWCQRAAGDAYDPDVMGPLMLVACEASAACAEAAAELDTREQVSRGSRGRR